MLTLSINIDKINLKLDKIATAKGRIMLSWSSDVGFGTYALWRNGDDNWAGDSECMDDNNDKAFILKLMELFVEKLNVRG